MNNNEVDKFLLAHKTEIADDGFSDQVMRSLPARPVNSVAIERLWAVVCLLVAIPICLHMEWFDTMMIDVKSFIVTLPFESGATQWFYFLGLPILLIWTSMGLLTRFTIYKLTEQ